MIDFGESGFEREPKSYFILRGVRDKKQLVIQCEECRGEMAFNPANHERFCSKCGLVDGGIVFDEANFDYQRVQSGQIRSDTGMEALPRDKRDALKKFEDERGITKKRESKNQTLRAERHMRRETYRLTAIFNDMYRHFDVVDDEAELKTPGVYYDVTGRIVKRTRIMFPSGRSNSTQGYYLSLLNVNRYVLKREYERRYGKIDRKRFELLLKKTVERGEIHLEQTMFMLAKRRVDSPPLFLCSLEIMYDRNRDKL